MTDLALPSSSTSLRSMAGIEARRLARHPAFIIGNVLAFAVLFSMYLFDEQQEYLVDAMSIPVAAAFFIGLTSLVATARLTRSTEATAEALGTAPGSEADRTRALVIACLVPFASGLVFMATQMLMAVARPPHPNEWYFATMPDWEVWAILVALVPVACLGGALLGVLTGRWLRFPGAPAVVVVAVVAVCMIGQLPMTEDGLGNTEPRLWVPWAMFHSGSMSDGTQVMYAGNPGFYLLYLLCLCALAALVAVWHDRTARTRRMRTAIVAVTVVGLACLALAMTTGSTDNRQSEPIPFQVDE